MQPLSQPTFAQFQSIPQQQVQNPFPNQQQQQQNRQQNLNPNSIGGNSQSQTFRDGQVVPDRIVPQGPQNLQKPSFTGDIEAELNQPHDALLQKSTRTAPQSSEFAFPTKSSIDRGPLPAKATDQSDQGSGKSGTKKTDSEREVPLLLSESIPLSSFVVPGPVVVRGEKLFIPDDSKSSTVRTANNVLDRSSSPTVSGVAAATGGRATGEVDSGFSSSSDVAGISRTVEETKVDCLEENMSVTFK